ncbi:MAG: alkaline phosphatase family protein [Planctomycetaceae bacterium]
MPDASKVLLVGWDAADWKVIRPLLAAGMMPNLAGLMARGVHGNIATLYPALSPTLWTSIATGKRPPKHGVLGFTEPSRDGAAVRPVTVLSRKTKALWNILAQEGKRSIVVGWWPSFPAEPIPGAMVSNHFQQVPDDPEADLPPLAPGVVSPARVVEAIADLRVRPAEIPLEVLRMFVPRADEVDQETDKSLHDLARILAETLSIHAAATDLIEHEPWDFAAVYFDTIDHASHRFMPFHPPRQRRVGEREFELYKDVVASVYRHHDAMLGRYLELAGPDAHVLVISDHGFHSDEQRPQWIPVEPAGPAAEHRHLGIVVMAGPGLRRGERIHGSSVLDVAPTVLALLGLPVGDDMDGQAQVQAWEEPPVVRRIPSWDDVPGSDGRHPPDARHDARAAAAQLEQLVALGYVAPLPDDRAAAVRETVRELDYNLARALADGGAPHEAIPLLERLWDEWPEEHRFAIHLLEYLARCGRTADRRRVLDTLRPRAERLAAEAAERLAALPASSAADAVAARQPEARRGQYERRRLVQLAGGLALVREDIDQAILEGDRAAAELRLRRMIAGIGVSAEFRFAQTAFAVSRLVRLGGHEEALPIVERLLEADREHPGLRALEAEIHFRRRDWQRVVTAAADALGLVYFNPRVHLLLGLALARQGRREDAVNELLVSLRQHPAQPRALLALERLHAHDPLRALEYRRRAADVRGRLRERRRAQGGIATPAEAPGYDFAARCAAEPGPGAVRGDEVLVVSGLPRSGTSMLMRVLERGGVPLLVDRVRGPDDSNRLGYYEYEPVKSLASTGVSERGWLAGARGRAVKVVAPLLRHLPPGSPTRVIVLHRPLGQVLASQEAMKARLGTVAGATSATVLARQFGAEMERIDALVAARPAWQVLHVSYERMLADPEGECRRIGRFLAAPFDAAAAATAVEASQRRF